MEINEQITKLLEIVTHLIKRLDKTNLQEARSEATELGVYLQKSRNEIQNLQESIR